MKSVLVGVCDKCNQVCLLSHQSTPAVKKQLAAQRKPVESAVAGERGGYFESGYI